MSLVVWLPLTLAVASATVLAGVFYFHWTWRYQKRLLGIISEVALACMIGFGGIAALGALWGARPWQ